MPSLRVSGSGLAKEHSAKLEASFDHNEAMKCLEWLRDITGEDVATDGITDKRRGTEVFHMALKSGILLCKAVNTALPGDQKIDFSKRAFKPTDNESLKSARERERLEIFLEKAVQVGVPRSCLFQMDCLYERTNLVQVCAAISALGSVVQAHPSYKGSILWPRRSAEAIKKSAEESMELREAAGLDLGAEFNPDKTRYQNSRAAFGRETNYSEHTIFLG